MITHEFLVRDPSDYSDAEAFSIARRSENANDPKEDKASHARALMEAHAVKPSLTNAQLRRSTSQNEYVIDGILVRNQPCVIAGPSKGMKTTLSIDMAISLASGTPFLESTINTRERVLFFTAEIGESTARELEHRISSAKGVYDELDGDQISWQTWVPYIPNPEHLQILRYEIERTKATIVVLDPMYQLLDGSTQSSYSMNGQQLRTISQLCIDLGATPIIIDHCKRSSTNAKEHAPLELEDISGAGKAEFFRQWILISRREKFEPGQAHKLWITIGGSAGHSSLLGVTIDDSYSFLTNERQFQVHIEQGHETRSNIESDKSAAAQEKRKRQAEATIAKYAEKVLGAFTGETRLTKTRIGTLAGLNPSNTDKAIAALLASKKLEVEEDSIGGRSRDVFYIP